MAKDFPYGNLPPYEGRCMMHPEEREALLECIPDRGRVCEIGTNDGITAAWLAERKPNASFISIDPFVAGPPIEGVQQCCGRRDVWLKNRHRNQILHVGTCRSFRYQYPGTRFEFVIIDGDHTYEACAEDLQHALAIISEGGIVAVHDYGHGPDKPELAGVRRAVDEAVKADLFHMRSVVRTLAILEPNV